MATEHYQSKHRPRKRFGQHFLADTATVQHIVSCINPRADDHLVEIGPGMGVLTQQLLPCVAQLDAVELDRDLIPKLQPLCLPLGNFHIHSADALKFDFCALRIGSERLRIVGNLPYNISTQLLFHLLDQVACIQDMHFMLQKEVVDRLAAQPGTSDYGKLSVVIQCQCAVQSLFDVPPQAFSPPPKVNSSVVRITPHVKPPVTIADWDTFTRVVAQAFAQRRKTLRNNLKAWIPAEKMQAIGVDPTRRAETLSLEEFARLADIVDMTT
jgi:16S rRNA (adenine1518-N6/adenine1519-N6)-dimethyltransferase